MGAPEASSASIFLPRPAIAEAAEKEGDGNGGTRGEREEWGNVEAITATNLTKKIRVKWTADDVAI